MARAHSIYIIAGTAGIKTAFTVKHEAVSWLNTVNPSEYQYHWVEIVRDGQPREKKRSITVAEFLAENQK